MAVNNKRNAGRPVQGRGVLSNATILESAKTLLVEFGKVPSIRLVARALEIDAMAIYHYFPSKAHLLQALTVALVEEIYEPKESKNWKRELEKLSASYLALLKKHGGLLETMLSMSVEGPSQVFERRLKLALSPLQLDEQTLNDALALLADYLHGYALAMHCCSKEEALTIEMNKGPLNLYMRALENSSRG